jgi:hypothetical protein
MTVATNGVLNIQGSETKYLSGTGTLSNYGSVAGQEKRIKRPTRPDHQ